MRIRAIAGLTGLLLFAGVLTAQPVGDSNDVLFATLPQPVSGQVVASTWTTLRWQPGHFAAMHRLYVSEDFNDVNEGTVAPVLTREAFQVVGSAGTPIPTGLVSNTTYYWRVDEVNDVHPDSPWKGEVWSFAVAPLTAWGPTPADGAALPVEATNPLTWNAGLGAAFHYWYFSEKFEDVNNAPVATGVPTQKTTFTPPVPLVPRKTYYWRIDEFDTGKRVFHRGAVWSFRAAQWVVVDSFEQYTETDPNLIWMVWKDGFEFNGTGALVGYLPGHNKPHTYETIFVRPGSTKSMPLFYDNSGKPPYPQEDASGSPIEYGPRLMYSEATLPLTPARDWSRYGDMTVTTLKVWYRGNKDNALENVAIVLQDGSNRQAVVPAVPAKLQSTNWQAWSIDLKAEVAGRMDLTQVASVTIRIGTQGNTIPGGAGLLYIDDIGLVAE